MDPIIRAGGLQEPDVFHQRPLGKTAEFVKQVAPEGDALVAVGCKTAFPSSKASEKPQGKCRRFETDPEGADAAS